MNLQIDKIMEKMTSELSCSAHSIDHVMRVYNLCKLIADGEESVNLSVLEPAALLHDIARTLESNDQSGVIDHALLGSEMAGDFLTTLGYSESLIESIQHCIATHRYRSGNEPKTIEAKILFDADKLDAIGSVGIARTFMLAGQFGQRIAATTPDDYESVNTAENGRIKDLSKHSPLMEYEYKLKKIPDRLYTERGKAIGRERVDYMHDFFSRLDQELTGKL
ncbi:MAG: HD domain-containing protein [Clostridia bacterium]|nr:HD domain-containing protein [Clostridia bacterium]